MATAAMTALQTTTLGTSASSVTFSSIPATYRDLYLVIFAKTTAGSYGFEARLNGDSGNNYSRIQMGAITSRFTGTSSASNAMESFIFNTSTSGQIAIMQIMDYSATDRTKTILVRSNDGDYITLATGYRWADTSAVTSVLVQGNDGESLAAGSTLSLYGIKGVM